MIAAARFIAVIDKDRDVRKTVRSLLQAHGFRTQAYASAEAFLLRGRTDQPACIVLDVDPEGMSGMELLDWLRADAPSVPVVVVTAANDESTRQSVLTAGGVAYLQKPFSADLLLAEITKAMTAER